MAPAKEIVREGCEALSRGDAALARAYDEVGVPAWRARPATYETLARIIAGQQISTKAAAAIWGRVEAQFERPVTAAALLATNPDDLRRCGLSRPKIAHLTAIADAIETGRLSPERICSGPVEEGRAELVAVKGIGPWTAEIFLLSAAGHLDAFPGADVGLMESYRQLNEVEVRMEVKASTKQGETWRPWRGVAAHLLWTWINTERAKAVEDS